MNKKVALYIRVSTDAQAEEGYSIDAQTEKLEAMCKVRGLYDYDTYIDGGYSGSNVNRPEMQRLIKDAKEKNLSHVIVYKLDRLSRSQKDTLYLIEDVFIPNEIDFISLNENIDTTTPYGRAMIGILSAFAQLERENIYMRTRMGMVERVKDGYWYGGGQIPFGYDYDRNSGTLIPNEDAPKVRQIYDLYINGYSAQKIANMLGLRYDKLVTQILERKSNTGVIIYKGEEYQGRHEPLISLETYNLAMMKMKERSSVRVTEANHLLTGLCYCGVCSARMRYQKWGKAGYKLVCYSSDKSKPHMVKDENCDNEKIWAYKIEDIVINDLFKISANLTEEDLQSNVEVINPVKMLEERITVINAKIKRLYNVYAENGNDLLLDTIKENELDLNNVKKQLAQENKHNMLASKINNIKEQIFDIEQSWNYMTPNEKQTIIRDCVEKIIINKNKIDIYYTFIKSNSEKNSLTA